LRHIPYRALDTLASATGGRSAAAPCATTPRSTAARRHHGARSRRRARRHRLYDRSLLGDADRWIIAQRIEVSGGQAI